MTTDTPSLPHDFDDLSIRAPSAAPAGGRAATGTRDPFGPQGNPFAPQGNPFAAPPHADAPVTPAPSPHEAAPDPFFARMDALAGMPPANPAADPFGTPAMPSSLPDPFNLPPQPARGYAPASYPPAGSDALFDLPRAPNGLPLRNPLSELSSLGMSPHDPSPQGLPPLAQDPFGIAPASGFAASALGIPRLQQPAVAAFDFGATPPPQTPPDAAPFGGGKLRHSRDEQIEKAFEIAALNPLAAAAAPLLWLAVRLHESMPPDDIRLFRDHVLEEVRAFETTAMAHGIAPRAVRIARYLLCANIDDILLNTSWGGQSNWAGAGLVSTLYSETIGGERFYDLLSQLYAAPDENVELLELIALCLSIGFVGKYRVMPGGMSQLNRLRSELYRTLRQIRGPYDRTLAPPWDIVAAPHHAPPRMLPLWLILGAALAILAGVYATFSIIVGNHLQATNERLAALVPALPVLVEKPPIPAIPQPRRPPPPPPPPVQKTQVERISERLQPEIADHKVEIVGNPDTVSVRLLNAPFPSARAALAGTEAPLLKRIAQALDTEAGAIRVIGYTDNVSVAPGGAFANNEDLSKARATSVATMLKQSLTNPDRVTVEGRGAANPIAPNTTAEGRAQNRRVELEIPAEKTR